jgi:hypothetical protein
LLASETQEPPNVDLDLHAIARRSPGWRPPAARYCNQINSMKPLFYKPCEALFVYQARDTGFSLKNENFNQIP